MTAIPEISSSMMPRYFRIEARRNWGGPDYHGHWLRLTLDLLAAEQLAQLREQADGLMAALNAREPHLVWIEEDAVLGVPRLNVVVTYADDMRPLQLAADDPQVLSTVQVLEAGLEPFLRSMPVAIHGRYLCRPLIPFVTGQRVRVVGPRHAAASGYILSIDPDTATLLLRTSTEARSAASNKLGALLTEDVEVHLRDLRSLTAQ